MTQPYRGMIGVIRGEREPLQGSLYLEPVKFACCGITT
jgi:hypothetical protein